MPSLPLQPSMGRVVVHTHGRARERGCADLIEMYAQRLDSRGVRLVQHAGKLSHDEYLERINRQADGGRLLLLDEEGESGSTEWLCERWKEWKLGTDTVHLAVGPVEGFTRKAAADHDTLSLGPLTLTYELAAVLLLEQLYRASEIERGSPYHRG